MESAKAEEIKALGQQITIEEKNKINKNIEYVFALKQYDKKQILNELNKL